MSRRKSDAPKRRRERPASERPGLIGRLVRALVVGTFRAVWALTWRLGVIVIALVALATGYFYTQLPPAERLFDGRAQGSVTMLDRHGDVFAWRGEQFGGELTIGEVSPHLLHAIIATEDKRFYDHFGVDPRGIARAMYENIKAGRFVQGGSTLTQQVAKNVFLGAGHTLKEKIERKLKEVPMALALEMKYSKDDILTVYINRVYLGAGTYGFEAAAQRYFGKSARVLTPAEAAMLAGLLKAPSRYAPTNDLSVAQGRASQIIRLMEEQGYLTESQVLEALANPARLSEAAAARAGGYFADWIMDSAPPYLTDRTTEDVTILTTFDPAIQRAAEDAVAHIFDTKVKEGSQAQAAVVVMRPDGAVLAMVGGHARGIAQFNRATMAMRQTGSAFKAIVYAAALESGMSPYDVVEDRPLTLGKWSPENYGGGYSGPVTLTEALARSINTVAVRVSEQAGRDRVRDLATEMGITTPIAEGAAIALGVSEATLLDMTGVFAVIANRGVRVTPWGAQEFRLRDDNTPLIRHDATGVQVISERSAGELTWMMREVIRSGTGRRAAIDGWDAAGKTGTTQAARDAWFIGFTGEYVVGVWMGNDDNTPLTGTTGGGLPAAIWREVMSRITAGRTPVPLPAIEPEPKETIAIGAADLPTTGDSIVDQIFRDVVESLGGESGGGGGTGDWKPYGAGDR